MASDAFHEGCQSLLDSVGLWAAEDALKNKVPWITGLMLHEKKSKLKEQYIVWLDNMLREHGVTDKS